MINTGVCPGFDGSVYLLQRDVFDQATDNSAWSRFANIHLLNVEGVGVRVLFSADDAAHSQIQSRHVYFRLFLRRRRGLLLLLLSWTKSEYRSSDDVFHIFLFVTLTITTITQHTVNISKKHKLCM